MSDIYVTFGGDTADLEASLATAKASVKDFSAELRTLAEQMQATGASADSALGQQTLAAAAKLTEAKVAVADLKKELKGAGGEGEATGLAAMAEQLKAMLAPIASIKASAGELIEVFAAAFAIEKVVEFIKSMGELGEATERTSKILGLTTEQVGELQYAFAATGTNSENLDQMMGRFEVSLAKVKEGQGPVAAGLRALGLSAQDLIGIPLPQQLEKIAAATSQFADGVNKTAALQSLGRGFVELIPLLDEGGAGFEELRQQAEAANVVLDEMTTEKLVDMQHGFVGLGASIKGDGVQAFLPFVNVVNGAVKIMTDLAQEFSDSVKHGGDMKDVLDLVAYGFQNLEQFVGETILIVKNFAVAGETAFNALNIASQGYGQVTREIFQALAAAIPGFFIALVTAGGEAVHAVEQQFIDLGIVIGDTLTLHFADAKAALGSFGADASTSADKIKGAFTDVFDFSAAERTAKETNDKIAALFAAGDKQIVENARVGQQEYNRIWGIGGAAPEAKAPTQQVPNLDVQTAARNKAAQEQLAATIAAMNTEVGNQEKATSAKIALYAKEEQAKQITEAQKVSLTLAALQEGLDREEDILEDELRLGGISVKQRQAVLDQETKLEQAYADNVAKIQEDAAAKTMQQWQNAFTTINGAFTSQISGLLTGTTTWAGAFKNVVTSLTEDLLKFFVEWGLKQAEQVAMSVLGINTVTTAQVTGSAIQASAQTSAASAGLLASLGGILKSIMASAAQTFAGVTGFMAPLIGPAAPAAGAAAEASVLAVAGGIYDTGAWSVPNDMLAVIHKDETVLPSRGGIASQFRDFASNGGFGGGGGGGDVHIHPTQNFHSQSMDSSGVYQTMRNNAPAMAKAMQEAVRHGALAGLRRLATT